MAVRLNKQSWAAIKVAYLQGRAAREIAMQFGVSRWTIHHRASAEKWRDDRTAPTQQDALAQALNRLSAAVENLTRQGGSA